MVKNFYMYEEIKLLKLEVERIALISENILSYDDLQRFKKALPSYDAVLERIGKDGIVTDRDLVKGFNETRAFVDEIKKALKTY